MNQPDQTQAVEPPAHAAPDADALIASLRAAGAGRHDPLRWRYIEVLAERAATHRGSARRLLDARLAHALAALKERFEHAQREASQAAAQCVAQQPHAAGELQRLVDAGDFKGVRQRIDALQSGQRCASLRALVRRLEQPAPEEDARVQAPAPAAPRPELKTIRNFRNAWSKLSVDKQVAQALEQAPKNAGPINSHMLMLRSLAMMRDISPDYLNRFMSYADALLRLDQGEKDKPATPKKPPAARAARAAKK